MKRTPTHVAHAWCLLMLAPWAAACGALPNVPAQRAVYGDLRKAVELSEDTGWYVDRVQLDNNLEAALRSVCQTDETARRGLRVWLRDRIDAHGGRARLRYLAAGHKLDGLDEVLTIERTLALLVAADSASEAECPFWLEPDPRFAGVEGNAGRTTLWLESQGFGAALFEGGETALSGGGGARVLVAHGFSPRASLAAGIEAGGSGTLDPSGTNEQLDTAIHLALPVALRWFDVSRVIDLQAAPVVRFNQAEDALPPGVRVSVGGGLATMRKGSFMPFVIVWLGYEGHGLFTDAQQSHSIRVGTRVGVDWDPSLR